MLPRHYVMMTLIATSLKKCCFCKKRNTRIHSVAYKFTGFKFSWLKCVGNRLLQDKVYKNTRLISATSSTAWLRLSSTGDLRISGEVSYTGWMLSTGFGSEFASRCSYVCTRWLLNTCLPTANTSPASLAVATCDQLTVVISTSHVWNLLHTEDVHLHTLALQIGTHFLLTLETVVFLFHLLSTTSKPFSSLSTRFGVLLQKTCYINSLLLLLLPLSVSLLYYLHLLWSTLSSFFRNRFQNNNNNNNKTSIAP